MAELSLKFEFKVSVDSSIKNEIFALLFNETNDSIFLQIFLRKSYCRLICRSNFLFSNICIHARLGHLDG